MVSHITLVLDTGEVRRLGEVRKRTIDLRVVGAVQDDASDRLARGAFRRDLYERLAGVVVRLPPLVERPEDAVLIARQFAAEQGQRLEPPAESVLERYDWPGNVRELRKVIQRAGPLVTNGTLPPSALREAIRLGTLSSRVANSHVEFDSLEAFTREDLVALCESCGWNAECIARARRIGRTTLFRQLRRAGVSLRALRKYHAYANVRVPHGTLAPPQGRI